MKLYLVWESSKGGKDLTTIYFSLHMAKKFCEGYNNYAKEQGLKTRAYIVEYDMSENYGFYNHKEMKED